MKMTVTLFAAMLLCAPLHAADRTWPDVRFATQKEGSFPSIERLRSLHAGLTKTQVREMLGSPHFWEGPFRSMQWNYLLHFRSPDSLGPPRSCRLQIDFNNKAEVTGYAWLPTDCAAGVAETSRQWKFVRAARLSTCYKTQLPLAPNCV